MIAQVITYLRERSEMMKWIFFVYLGFTLVFDFFADRHHTHFWGDNIIGFWAIFALVGCLLIIVICKGLSHVWLERDTDYYDK
jgi:drug/metabolite transporter (DMT)-like permease